MVACFIGMPEFTCLKKSMKIILIKDKIERTSKDKLTYTTVMVADYVLIHQTIE